MQQRKLSYEEFLRILGLIPCELASIMYELYKEKYNEGDN